MREFMTRMSDYIHEKWNDPERQESRAAVVLIGAVAVVVIVLLLLLLWRYAVQKEEKTDAAVYEESHTGQETAAEYMADSSSEREEALRQEYLTSVEYLNSKVEELLQTMTQIQESLKETIERYQEKDSSLQTQITKIYDEVSRIVRDLKETQVELDDLADLVQVISKETLPAIQKQLVGIQGEIGQMHTDIASIYTKIAALETEDEKLWASLKSLETKLKTTMSSDMAEVEKSLRELAGQIGAAEERLAGIVSRMLMYEYKEDEHTLYLLPGKE